MEEAKAAARRRWRRRREGGEAKEAAKEVVETGVVMAEAEKVEERAVEVMVGRWRRRRRWR